MWFWALNGYTHLDPFYGTLLDFGCSFQSMGKKRTLKGLQLGSLNIISSHRMKNLLKKSSHGVITQLHSIQMQPSVVSTPPLDLRQILDRYACVFAEPMGFPPSILDGHRILLLPGSIPSNIRPIPTRI